MEETDPARSGQARNIIDTTSGRSEIYQTWQDFSVTRRLTEDKGKDKTLEAILRRQDTWDKT